MALKVGDTAPDFKLNAATGEDEAEYRAFHDAMLLKLEARELPTSIYPRIMIAGHRLSLKAMTRVAWIITDSESSRNDFLRFVDYSPDRVRAIWMDGPQLYGRTAADEPAGIRQPAPLPRAGRRGTVGSTANTDRSRAKGRQRA